jgi:hypothetical protein
MAFAFYKSSSALNTFAYKASYYYNEAGKTIQADGSLLLATQRGTATDSWILQPWRAMAPTSWYILYYNKFNPFTLY